MFRIFRTAAIQFSNEGSAFLAQAIAFSALFAVIPLTLLGVAVLGFVYGTHDGGTQALTLIQTYAPVARTLVASNFDSIVRYRGLSGIIGLIGLIWSGKNIFQALAYALDRSLGVPQHRSYVHDVLLALALVPVAGIVMLLATFAPVIISVIVRVFGLASFTYLPEIGTYAVAFVIVFVVSALLYTYLPNRRSPGIRFGIPGAAVTAIGWSILQVAFAISTTHTNFLAIYGAVSAAFALLLWMQLTAVIFLFGAHVCTATERRVRKSEPGVEAA